jgi:hypothetical protein
MWVTLTIMVIDVEGGDSVENGFDGDEGDSGDGGHSGEDDGFDG